MSKPSNLRIEDVAATTARADLNDILVSIASLQTTDGNSSAYTGEPTTTYPNMMWYDKSTSILKMRTTADDAWINVAYVDQSGNAYRIFDDTQVVNSSGTQTGLIGDQATATWQTGTATTESLVSPAKVKAAILANQTTSVDVENVDSLLTGPHSNTFGQYSYGGTTVLGTVTGLTDCYILFAGGSVTATNPGTSTLRVDRSTNNGSSWGDSLDIVSATDTTSADSSVSASGAITIPMSGYNAIRIVHYASLSIYAVGQCSNAVITGGSF